MRQARVVLGLSVLALVAIGFVVLSSAGGPVGLRTPPSFDQYHFVKQQAIWLALSLPMFLCAVFFDYHNWRKTPWLTVALYSVIILSLGAVFLFDPVNGSRRWLKFGPIRIQPSEFSKITIIISLSVFLDDLGSRIRFFRKGAAKAVGVLALPMVLVLGEPDFGSSMVMALTGGVLLFVAGMLMKHIFMIGGFGAVGCISFFLLFENRRRRIAPWLPDWLRSNIPSWFPWREDFVTVSEAAKTTKDQLNHALVAIRNGGDMGVGFGNSMQKQMYLPENHTDFIFAIGAEEWGLVFSLLLLALFVTVFVCGVVISAKSCDRLGKFIAFGISFLIFFQVLFNIGVVTGLLPTKGLALPLISYGGTNLMSTLISIGILMNVSRQSDLHRQREKSRISAVFHNKGGL